MTDKLATPLCDTARQWPLGAIPTDKERAARYMALAVRMERDRAMLREALQRIAEGQVMSGEFTHVDTVHEYQRIARDAIAKAEGA